MIYNDDDEEEEKDEENKIIKEEKAEIETKPMEQIFEIVLNNFACQEYKENLPVVKNIKRKKIKNVKWIKFYV